MKPIRDEEGQTLVVVALSLTVLLGFVGFAADVGLMLRQRRIAQTVADSAAIAAAFESLNEGIPSTVTSGMWTAASHDATLNGLTPGASNGTQNSTNGVTLTLNINPNISVTGYNSAGYVQASVSLNTSTFFMNLFGIHTINVGATAIASNSLDAAGCFNVQNDGGYADPAASMGGSSFLSAASCGVTVNGDVDMGGSSRIQAKFLVASGTVSGGKGVTGPVYQNGAPTSDPLPKLQQSANQPTVPSGTKPGGACVPPAGSGMSCIYNYNNGNLSGNLQKDTIYYFDNNVTTTCKKSNCVSISGSLTGSNDTIYLAGNVPLDFANNGNLSLTPPGYGSSCAGSLNPLCGILIDAPSDGSGGNGTYTCSNGKGNNDGNPGEMYFDFGSSTTDLEGVIYAPYMQLFVQDQGASTTLNNDVVIGNFCAQSATVTVNGYSPAYSPLSRIGLVY